MHPDVGDTHYSLGTGRAHFRLIEDDEALTGKNSQDLKGLGCKWARNSESPHSQGSKGPHVKMFV